MILLAPKILLGKTLRLPGYMLLLPDLSLRLLGYALRLPGQTLKLPGWTLRPLGRVLRLPGQTLRLPCHTSVTPGLPRALSASLELWRQTPESKGRANTRIEKLAERPQEHNSLARGREGL